MCLYLPSDKEKNEDQLVGGDNWSLAQARRCARLASQRAPMGEQLVREIAAALGADVTELLPFASGPLRIFYSQAICAGLVMRLQKNGQHRGTHVPMAFQSALAGALLAAAVTAGAAGLEAPQETKSVIDVLRPLGAEVLVPVARDVTGRCIAPTLTSFIISLVNMHEVNFLLYKTKETRVVVSLFS